MSIGTVQEAIMNGTAVVAGYVHGDVRGLSKTGALVALQSPGDNTYSHSCYEA